MWVTIWLCILTTALAETQLKNSDNTLDGKYLPFVLQKNTPTVEDKDSKRYTLLAESGNVNLGSLIKEDFSTEVDLQPWRRVAHNYASYLSPNGWPSSSHNLLQLILALPSLLTLFLNVCLAGSLLLSVLGLAQRIFYLPTGGGAPPLGDFYKMSGPNFPLANKESESIQF